MSSKPYEASNSLVVRMPEWFPQLLACSLPSEGGRVETHGRSFVMRDGILRSEALVSASQAQTAKSFGFKWGKRDLYEKRHSSTWARQWLVERYGDVAVADWWNDYAQPPLLLDAGCGAARSTLELFPTTFLGRVRYLGADVSNAVDVAYRRFVERGLQGAFLQVDLNEIPLPESSVDVIYSEGVLHHTDSTEKALKSLAKLLKSGGRFLFYVYRKKGPVREFTDDYVRDKLQRMSPEEGWDALLPLTKLGEALGKLSVEVNVTDAVDLLGIPPGRISLQRLFYWHFMKAFYDPERTTEELNLINYDWYAPRNAHRQTPEQVRGWCRDAGLIVERENIQEAGITVIARKA